MTRPYRILIDNRFCESSSGRWTQSINPATEQVIGVFPSCDDNDVNQAVTAARRAASRATWARMHGRERAAYLRKVADGIRRRSEELARVETEDSGKPLFDNINGDIPEAANCFDYFASYACIGERGHLHKIPFGQFHDYTIREPIGVIALIAPWNFPLVNAAWKIAPAIAAGNCVVYKPASEATLSTLLLADILREADLPPGVVNILSGSGSVVGAALTSHPEVDKISFTGSTQTGRTLLHSAADGIKGCLLELGGKSANIVFADCDLETAVKGTLWSIFFNAGQVCTAGSRLLIHEAIYDEFMEELTHATRQILLGDPMDPATRMGPLISALQHQRVMSFIETAHREGAQLRVGGSRPEGFSRGFFVQPTIFEKVTPDMLIDREEIFGPVLVVHRFRTEEEAIALANHTSYGLAAGIWTRDLSRAHRLAHDLEAGTVWVNNFNVTACNIPFAGFKQSGIGIELGKEGFQEYTRLKNVCIDLDPQPVRYFV